MSIRVEGVIDLSHVDLKDLDTLYELFLFLQENNISVGFFNPKEWLYILKDGILKDGVLKVIHKERDWSYFEFHQDGRFFIDKHHTITEKQADDAVKAIREFYPMVKKALEVLKSVPNAKLSYDREREKLVIEVEEL